MQKTASFKIKGMQRDLAVSAFNPEYAYENKNIRIMPTDESTLFSIVNEKGNKTTNILGIGNSITGIPIGQAVINDELVLFTCGDKDGLTLNISAEEQTVNNITAEESTITDIDLPFEDKIYKIWFNNGALTGKKLYTGDLGFDYEHPIEAISFFENSDIRKVYWTDGLNQPRVINVAASSTVMNSWNNNSFDFVRKLSLTEKVTVERNTVANGSFAPGVIQYALTYFSKYSQESNIFYISPLFYISFNNRGASPEDVVGNSFSITIEDSDTSFDYIRIYSIHRTSINAIPTVRIVADLATSSSDISYTDTGTYGDSIDPTELLYVGGEEVIFGTMEQKDNTLFLGDITLNRRLVSSTIKNFFRNKTLTFTRKTLVTGTLSGYYPYTNQLIYNSSNIKGLKYLETYRFGVQLQHYTGKWSEPIWIRDSRVTEKPTNVSESDIAYNIQIPIAQYHLQDSSIIKQMKSEGYVKIRPVIVFPKLSERECVCQGVLCPTVFNVEDRNGNSPFAQSSWFTRPLAPFDVNTESVTDIDTGATATNWDSALNTRWGVMSNEYRTLQSGGNTLNALIYDKGRWAEFRHYRPIPDNKAGNAEIQCITSPKMLPTLDSELTDIGTISEWVARNRENFYVDQSIVTLHSPDIEFDDSVKSIDSSKLKLRIIGYVPLTSFVGDIAIQTSTPANNYFNTSNIATGFYEEPIGDKNVSRYGFRGLMGGLFWIDEVSNPAEGYTNENEDAFGFMVYPFHRNGSLNNMKSPNDEGYRSAMLKTKVLSNLRYSFNSEYLDTSSVWNAYISGNNNRTGISGVSIFDSNEVTAVKIPAPLNSTLPDLTYYGNVDKIISSSRAGSKADGYNIVASNRTSSTWTYSKENIILTLSRYFYMKDIVSPSQPITTDNTGLDPIYMRYKSTPHAVIAFNYTTSGRQPTLPIIKDSYTGYDQGINSPSATFSTQKLFWDINCVGIYSSVINVYPKYGILWLGELYNDEVVNRFGGTTEEALEANEWLPAGEAVSLDAANIYINWTEGDTYYQRYDHLKTYPFSTEEQNGIVDIISFMCETRVNLDGRYDQNRGQTSNLSITPQNFNLLNPVYGQSNNFFTYRYVNTNKLNLDTFPNTITWTKAKTAGELVDTWTNITLASTLDLDGDKGNIRALKRFNNNLIAFQDKGISQILYNENMQITSTEGVPIEIANSGKVNGKRYITNNIGCTNKWSICETPNGIYFIDDITKGIFLFNGQLNNISDKLGFHSWINKSSKDVSIWDPVNFNSFVTYYDKVNGDVFFISKEECLGYSESLGQFTSFYSYENTPFFSNLEDRGIWVKDNKLWLHTEGNYNIFFDKYQPFYTTIIANPDMQSDKIFNNLEFRADSWSSSGILLNSTFDTLNTWNEYQNGRVSLTNTKDIPSTLKKKFRIWRANIPRDSSNNRDRMRNPWLYIKLSMENSNTNKTILHDMMVHYFE